MCSTTRMVLPVIVTLAAATLVSAQAENPCDLLRPIDIGPVVGRAAVRTQFELPKRDPNSGALQSNCMWTAGDHIVGVMVTRFGTVGDATRGLKEAERVSNTGTDGVRLGPAAGPGDTALWGTSDDGDAWWVVRRGTALLMVSVSDFNGAARLREPLKRPTETALSRLRQMIVYRVGRRSAARAFCCRRVANCGTCAPRERQSGISGRCQSPDSRTARASRHRCLC
jgi:hypothetical protein